MKDKVLSWGIKYNANEQLGDSYFASVFTKGNNGTTDASQLFYNLKDATDWLEKWGAISKQANELKDLSATNKENLIGIADSMKEYLETMQQIVKEMK